MFMCNLPVLKHSTMYSLYIIVADSITITGGAAISRVRLLDEEEQVSRW